MTYVTILDSLYFPHFMALYRSMQRTHESFKLWVVAMDQALETALVQLALKEVQILPAAALDDSRLLALREQRSRAEFFWTLTPFLHQLVWRQESTADVVTYVDSDIYFLRRPNPLEADFTQSGRSMMITPHAYSARFDASAESGYFCVQYIPASRAASQVLEWWQSACTGELDLPWQSDQKFLDDWPLRFPEEVHVLSRPELVQGPWNMERFPYSEAVAFHFHGLRMKSDRRIWLGTNPIPRPTLQHVYRPYMADLTEGRALAGHLGLHLPTWQHPMNWRFRLGVVGARAHRGLQSLRAGKSARLPSMHGGPTIAEIGGRP